MADCCSPPPPTPPARRQCPPKNNSGADLDGGGHRPPTRRGKARVHAHQPPTHNLIHPAGRLMVGAVPRVHLDHRPAAAANDRTHRISTAHRIVERVPHPRYHQHLPTIRGEQGAE